MFPLYFIVILIIPIIFLIYEHMELARLQRVLSKLEMAIKYSGLPQLDFPSSTAWVYSNKSQLLSRIEKGIHLLLKEYSSGYDIHFTLSHSMDENRRYKRLERKIDKLLHLTSKEVLIFSRVRYPILLTSNLQLLDGMIEKLDRFITQISDKQHV